MYLNSQDINLKNFGLDSTSKATNRDILLFNMRFKPPPAEIA